MSWDVLCTAEDFGFGPSAALHQLVPHLRQRSCSVTYAGSGITLDMHTTKDYVQVHSVDVRQPDGRRSMQRMAGEHGRVFSVCDVDAAEAGCAAGADVVLYDILAWFRDPLPAVFSQVGLLLCPNFFGLQERLRAAGCTRAHIVGALMPPRAAPVEALRRRVLINLGGLHTPYTSDTQCAAYAQLVVDGVREAAGEPCPTVLTSHSIGARLHRCHVLTVTPTEARQWLASCEMAFMTAGLGNIVDAAGQNVRVCFLPAMSDTQGLQSAALRQRDLVRHCIDWHDLTQEPSIDYNADKPVTVPSILSGLQQTQENVRIRLRWVDRLRAFVEDTPAGPPTLRREFTQLFGSEDGRDTAAAVAAHFAKGDRRAHAS